MGTLLGLRWALLFTLAVFLSTTYATSRYAYATIHYEGTPRDNEYVLAIRVMVRSLKQTGTKHDILVLISDNVRESTREVLTKDGCKLIVVPNIPNPYRDAEERRTSYKPRFEYTLNKLHLWNLTQYERVIYLDADNLILQNMEELFQCGHFCVVFMNMCVFHTGLMVVKPDTAVFTDMVSSLGSLPSDDGADQGFLSAYFSDMEFAPLFNVSAGVSERPKERLFSGYNLNHMYYYENWNFNRYRKYHFAQFPIPGLSLAYPIAPAFKPWYWYAYGLVLHWEWDAVRAQLGEDHMASFMAIVVTIGITYLVLSPNVMAKVMQRRGLTYTLTHTAITELIQQVSWKVGKRTVAAVFGLGTTVSGILVGIALVPGMMPPKLAWPLFAATISAVHIIGLRWYSWICRSQQLNAELLFSASFALDCVLVLIFLSDLYTNPIQKILVTLVLTTIFIFFKLFCYNHVATHSGRLKKGVKSGHDASDAC